MCACPDQFAPYADIHHHGDACLPGAQCGGFVNHALLQPELPDAELDTAIHDGGNMLGCAKHIHDVRQFGQAFQVGVRFLAQYFSNHRAHRYDAVTITLQALRNMKAGAIRVGRQTQHRHAMNFAQQTVDFIGVGIGELHGEVVRCSATIIYHCCTN